MLRRNSFFTLRELNGEIWNFNKKIISFYLSIYRKSIIKLQLERKYEILIEGKLIISFIKI